MRAKGIMLCVFALLCLLTCANIADARPKWHKKEFWDVQELDDPCERKSCPKGSQCFINMTSNEAECMCRPTCKPHRNPVCGSDGVLYDNHCELHRAACLMGRHISIMHGVLCTKATTPATVTPAAPTPFIQEDDAEEQAPEEPSEPVKVVQTTTTRSEVVEDVPSAVPNAAHNNDAQTTQRAKETQQVEEREQAGEDERTENADTDENEPVEPTSKPVCEKDDMDDFKMALMEHYRQQFTNPGEQDDGLPAKGARFLVSSIFNHMDTSRDSLVDVDELENSKSRDNTAGLSDACVWEDILLKHDKNGDGRLSAPEMYDLFGIESVRIATHLQEKSLTATVGDSIVISCEVSSRYSVNIVWDRNGGRLEHQENDGINYYGDGRLYFVDMKLFHAGTYTCYADMYPEVKQTYTVQVQVPPSVKICPHNQLKPKGTTATVQCSAQGLPEPVKTWRRNNIDIANAEKFDLKDANSTLLIREIDYADTGIFDCIATNDVGTSKASASVFIRDTSSDLNLGEQNIFYFFHQTGIQIIEPDTCTFQESFKATVTLPDSSEVLCNLNKTSGSHECHWGDAVNVNNHLIYATQPYDNRIIVIDVKAKEIVEVIQTEKMPVFLKFIPQLNSIWVDCWRSNSEVNLGKHSVEVVRYADGAPPHFPIHIEPVGQHFDLVENFFIPSEQFVGQGDMKFGYLVHRQEQGMTKINLEDLTHGQHVDLSSYDCHPNSVAFLSLGGYALVNCDGHVGPGEKQLFVDYITNKVVRINEGVKGHIYVSPDGRYVISVDMAEQHIQVQKVSDAGKLTTSFQVSTNLHISDLGFFPALTSHSYDLYATSRVRQDIIYINLESGKVEMIPDVHKPIDVQDWPWNSRNRRVVSSGDFGPYMVSPSSDHIVILNGPLHRVHCDVDNIKNANVMAWVGLC